MADAPFVPDLALLEAHSILRRTPSWEVVQGAAKRLSELKRYPQPYDLMEPDRDNVLQYAGILQRSADTVARGICLASHLGRFSPATTPADRFSAGLRALAEGLELRDRDEVDTSADLKRCMSAAFTQPFDFQPFGQTPTVPMFDNWRGQLQTALQTIDQLPPVSASDARDRAWTAWLARLIATMGGASDVPIDIDYLRCRAGNLAPGTILRPNPKAMVLADWSEAYIKSLGTQPSDSRDGVPLWFAFGVLGVLGFDLSPELIAAAQAAPLEATSAKDFVAKAPTSHPRKGVIVIRVPAGSSAAMWRAPRTIPALSVTADQFHTPARIDLTSYFLSRLIGVLIELEPNESVDDGMKRVQSTRILSRLRVKLGVLVRTRPDSVPSNVTVAVAPPDLASACAQAFDFATS